MVSKISFCSEFPDILDKAGYNIIRCLIEMVGGAAVVCVAKSCILQRVGPSNEYEVQV